jgi:hypothetical protein
VPIAYISDDWQTQGDWVGRYGRQFSELCAANSPFDDTIGLGMVGQKFSLKAADGLHTKANDVKRNWLQGLSSNDGGALWDCYVGTRRQSMWDDHGEAYSAMWESPDLQIDTTLPEGVYRMSFYFEDYDGQPHDIAHNQRDFLLLAGITPSDKADFTPVARARAEQFRAGVYKQFLLAGEQSYHFQIRREGSLNSMLTGIFVDRLAGPPSHFDDRPLGCMGSVRCDPPLIPALDTLPAALQRVASLREKPLDPDDISAISLNLRENNILSYRAANGISQLDPVLGAWRWSIPIWNQKDRAVWNDTIKRGWNDFLKLNPGLGPKDPK